MWFSNFGPKPRDRDVRLSKSGCQGFCQMGPLVSVVPDGILYTKVRERRRAEIVERRWLAAKLLSGCSIKIRQRARVCRGLEDNPFYAGRDRLVLARMRIPRSRRHSRVHAARGLFGREEGISLKCLRRRSARQISESGLRGRGGGGFPTGRKWEAARIQKSAKKYVICNGDEGDPGAFMNRSVMEGNPHSVIEGLMIAARAIGADETLGLRARRVSAGGGAHEARGCGCGARRHSGQQRVWHRPHR